MADIKIYGTLVNDTAEPIAKTTQVCDPTSGKNVNELIEDAKASATAKPWLLAIPSTNTADGYTAKLTDVTDWESVLIPLEDDDQGSEFPGGVSTALKFQDYCGIALQYDLEHIYFFPFSYLYDDGDLSLAVEFQPVLGLKNLQLYKPYMDYLSSGSVNTYGLRFKKLEFGSGSGLTPWQQAYLEGLEKQEIAEKFSATMTLSQSQKDFDGTATTVTIYVTPKFDGANVSAVVTGTSSNLSGKTFTKGSDGRYSAEVTIPAPSTVNSSAVTTNFSVSVKYNHATAGQLTKTLNATHTQNVKSYILKDANATDISSTLGTRIANAAKTANTLKGSHSLTIASGGEYVFFAMPSGSSAINKVTSGGFDVPITTLTTSATITKGSSTLQYMIFRTTSKPQTSPFSIVIS